MKTQLLVACALFLTAACTTDTMTKEPRIGMPNPASAYCIAQGGTLETRTEAAGQVSYCHLPDGKVVEEWALFRAHHPAPKS